jgi:hypothetical protein
MLRTFVVAVALLLAVLVPGGPVAAATGDLYVRNAGDSNQPGRDTDPHLTCADVELLTDRLARDHGTFTVDGQPPSGSSTQDYPATGAAPWQYPPGRSGTQVVATIPMRTLIDNARRNGDAPDSALGYHFRVGLVEDQSRHRTFWVACDVTDTPRPAAGAVGTSTTTTSTSAGSASSAAAQSTTSSTTTTTTTRQTSTTASRAAATTSRAATISRTSSSSSTTSSVHSGSTTTAASGGSTSSGGAAGAQALRETTTPSPSPASGAAAVPPGTGSGPAAPPAGGAAAVGTAAPATGGGPGPALGIVLALVAAGLLAVPALLRRPQAPSGG